MPWPLPPGQRLDRHHQSRAQVDHRLVVKDDLVCRHGPMELTLEVEPLHHVAVQVLLEHRESRPTALLGPVHGGVGVSDEQLGLGREIVAVGRMGVRSGALAQRHGDAHAGPHEHGRPVQIERRPELDGQAGRHRRRAGFSLDVLTDEEELVAAEAPDRVAGTQRPLEARGHLLEQPVTGGVAEAVVDHLEVVQVDEQHRERDSQPSQAPQSLLDPVEQERPVGQAGEPVVQCLVLEGGLEVAALDGDRREVRGPLEQQQLFGRGAPDLGQVDGDGADQGPGSRGGEAHRPAGVKAEPPEHMTCGRPAEVRRKVVVDHCGRSRSPE